MGFRELNSGNDLGQQIEVYLSLKNVNIPDG